MDDDSTLHMGSIMAGVNTISAIENINEGKVR